MSLHHEIKLLSIAKGIIGLRRRSLDDHTVGLSKRVIVEFMQQQTVLIPNKGRV